MKHRVPLGSWGRRPLLLTLDLSDSSSQVSPSCRSSRRLSQHKYFQGSRASILQICCVLGLAILSLSQVTLAADGTETTAEAGSPLTPAHETVTVTIDYHNSTQNTSSTTLGSSPGKGNTGAIVASIIIALIACTTIVIAVYFFKRKRQSRMLDKEKKMQIQMSSARNAGVYQDLTVSVPAEDKLTASPEHERLKAAEDA